MSLGLTDEPGSTIVSIQDLLEQGNREMPKFTSWCRNCKGEKKHEKFGEDMHFEVEERHLCLHLKRITTEKKLFNLVTFPDDTGDVTIYDHSTQTLLRFRVQSIIVHVGEGKKTGHYYAVGRKGTYNDAVVQFDNGKSFRKLLLSGVLRVRDGIEDKSNDAYGCIYLLVQVPPWCGLNNKNKMCFANAVVQALAIAFLPISIFQARFTKSNIQQANIANIRKGLAKAFWDLTNSLDLTEHTTNLRRKDAEKKCETNDSIFHHTLNQLKRSFVDLESKRDGGVVFLKSLWGLLDKVLPERAYVSKTQLRCDTCKTLSSSEDSSNILTLSLTDDQDSSIENIQHLLDQKREEEKINMECDACGDNKPHTRSESMYFEDEQCHLCLHLNRYINDKKLLNLVTFPDDTDEVTIYDHITKELLRFRVESIIVHAGEENDNGHYYAVGRKGTYNDDVVQFDNGKSFRKLLSNGVLRVQDDIEDKSNDAYGYMYLLVKIPLTENPCSSSSSSARSFSSSSSSFFLR